MGPFSRYLPVITAFAQSVRAKAAYCFVVDGELGTGGCPLILDAPTREAYEQRCRELVELLRRSADMLEADLRRQGF